MTLIITFIEYSVDTKEDIVRIHRGDKGKWHRKMSPQHGDEGKSKRNAQVVRG